ncbi:MAG: response regulator [Treponema sp.]|nr:response regulator [Treponema sp.]
MEVINRLNILITEEGEFHGKKRILVVDDDSTMLRTMNNWFSSKYEVFMANSGMNAISLLAQKKVDLILLDYEMPVVSGLQVFEMLKSEVATASIPVIFLTSKDDKETVMKVLAAKPEKYLLKTRPAEELIKSVDDFFRGN